MAAPPDFLVHDELKAQIAALAVNDAHHRALFDALFYGEDLTLRDRVWASFIAHPPVVLPGYHRGDEMTLPCVLVILQEERPEKPRVANRIGTARPITIGTPPDDAEYVPLGGTWRQSVLLLLLDMNPERIRYDYLVIQKIMYIVARKLMEGRKVGGAFAGSAGELTPMDDVLPPQIMRRSMGWDFTYDQNSFVASPATGSKVTVAITGAFTP